MRNLAKVGGLAHEGRRDRPGKVTRATRYNIVPWIGFREVLPKDLYYSLFYMVGTC